MLSLRSGRLPEKEGEIAVEASWAKTQGISPGDTVVFDENYIGDADFLAKLIRYDKNESGDVREYLKESEKTPVMEYLTTSAFTIVGLVESPTFLIPGSVREDSHENGLPVDIQMFVTIDSFRKEALAGYRRVLIVSDDLRGFSYREQGYADAAAILKKRVETCLKEITAAKNEHVLSNIPPLKKGLKNGLDDAEKEIADAQSKLNSAEKELADAKKEYEIKSSELADSKNKLSENRTELDKAKEDYSRLLADYGANHPQVKATAAALEANEAKLDEMDKAMLDAEKELRNAKTDIDKAEKELNDGLTELADAREDADNANRMYEDLDETEFESYDAIILTRESSNSYALIEITCNSIRYMRISLAGTFVLIGLLVCYSALTRFVNQQMRLIGTKKALGMRQKEIYSLFLTFTGLSVAAGCIIGGAVLAPIIEVVILHTISGIYNVGNMEFCFNIAEALIISATEFGLLLFMTWLAIRKTLRHSPVSLLNGPEPPAQKQHLYEKLFFWKKLSLVTKTIINNCATDMTRVLATVVGIAGATTLLVLSVTIYKNVEDSINTQFSKIFQFDYVVTMDSENSDTIRKVKDALSEHGIEGTAVYWENTVLEPVEDEYTSLRLVVPQNKEEFDRIVKLYDGKSGKKLDNNDGFSCCYSVLNWYGNGLSQFTIYDRKGKAYPASPDNFVESFLCTGFMYMTPEKYTEIFGENPKPNAVLFSMSGADPETVRGSLNNIPGVVKTTDFRKDSELAFDSINSLVIALVAVYLCVSVIMSILVLYNLLNQFIMEKKKELLVLRINGYTIHEAKRYIYSDTVILGTLSIVLGVLIGSMLGEVSMSSFDASSLYLMREPSLLACIFGITVCGILTAVVTAVALKQIESMKLTDVNQ